MARSRPYNDAPLLSPPSVNVGGASSLNTHGGLVDGNGGRPRKRLRTEDDGYINSLPDDILIGVISRLTIREAVATGAVSARWRHLWKRVPKLSLRARHIRLRGYDDDVEPLPPAGVGSWGARARAARLAGVASSILRQHRGVGVDKLVFSLPLAPCCHAAELDQAVEFAVAAGTRELHLSLSDSHCGAHEHHGGPTAAYEFPHWRFGSAGGRRLRTLLLCNVSLAVAALPGLEGLAQLMHLDLTRVTVDDADVANILSACAALTFLALKHCRQVVHLNVSHARLLLLTVDNCRSLKSITVQSSTLLELAYRGQKVVIKYNHAPTMVKLKMLLCNANECPLDCMPGAGALPRLKQLCLQFPSPLNAAAASTQLQAVQNDQRFAGLNLIVLQLKTPWREHVASVAALLIAAPSVKELRVEAYNDLPVPPPTKQLVIEWPKRCSPKKLQGIVIGGFSGEPELMELVFFLLQRSPALRTLAIDTHRRHLRSNVTGWRREETEDTLRCYYARGVAWTHLPPKTPSTVKLTIL